MRTSKWWKHALAWMANMAKEKDYLPFECRFYSDKEQETFWDEFEKNFTEVFGMTTDEAMDCTEFFEEDYNA